MLVTFIFDRSAQGYENLLKVWDRSASRHMPKVLREVVRLDPPEEKGRLVDITFAFMAAIDYVLSHDYDCIITDVDMMFKSNMMTPFVKYKDKFDIAVTKRDHPCPYNTGVWYYRNTPEARKFVELWRRETIRIDKKVGNGTEAERAMLKKYGGLDQASLVSAIEKNQSQHLGAKVLKLPCKLYNAEQSCWDDMHPKCKAVHIKSELRAVCAGYEPRKWNVKKGKLIELANEWRSYL